MAPVMQVGSGHGTRRIESVDEVALGFLYAETGQPEKLPSRKNRHVVARRSGGNCGWRCEH